jgi:uncharacterized protein YyaL (SSP411 family)
MSQNQLARETSPYLLQHKDNPVHWRPWGKDALDEAARENKPLLVSVGYAACHWCHVMAHESFEDAETAAMMNELYIPVKVDREERPDLDNWLQTAVAVSGQSGGWPLTAFLTPRGEPFFAGTYFPKEESYGRPGFKTVLRDLSARYRETPQAIEPNIRQIAQIMERAWSDNRSGQLDPLLMERVAVAMAQRYDIFFGGMVGAPKFPNVPSLKFLWRSYLRSSIPQFMQVVLTALDAMCRGGIYDHVGGGFSRYATDERWIVPHFEKMLYDNAQLLEVLTLVWQHNRNPMYRNRIEDTVGWVLREMLVEGAGFASSLDADSEGQEGRFYTWTDTEIDATLMGTMAPRFRQAYGVTKEGNFEGRNILHRFIPVQGLTQADETLFAAQRSKLLKAREARVRPFRDDKVLADWNGMMIAALAEAGAVMRQQSWIDAAKRAFAFVVEKLGDGDLLFHTYREGKRQHPGFSDDYANMARAALALWEITGDRSYFERAQTWTRVLDEQFWDLAQGGYAFSQPTEEPVQVRIRTAFDNQTPAANGIMLEVLARLFYTTGEQAYSDRVNALVTAFAGDVPNAFLQMSTYLSGFEYCVLAIQVVIVGPNNDPRTHDLINAVLGRSLPNRLLMVVAPGEGLPAGHPVEGKTMQNGQPTAYVCQGRTCSAPVTSAVALSQMLQLPQGAQTPVQAAMMPAVNNGGLAARA